MTSVIDCMARHRTIRKFDADVPDDALVRRAVEAAQHAATSSHVQAYSLLRVRDTEKRAALVELTGGQPQVARAGAFFVVSADQRRYRLIAERAGSPYVPNLETFLVAVIDASLFAQNLALAFESCGWGCCYIGGLRNRIAEVDELLQLPSDVLPLYGLCVGKPAENPSPRARLPVEGVLFDDRYPGDAEMLRQVERFDAVMGEEYARRGKPGYDWSGGVVRKFRAPQREHLLEFYRSKGACFA